MPSSAGLQALVIGFLIGSNIFDNSPDGKRSSSTAEVLFAFIRAAYELVHTSRFDAYVFRRLIHVYSSTITDSALISPPSVTAALEEPHPLLFLLSPACAMYSWRLTPPFIWALVRSIFAEFSIDRSGHDMTYYPILAHPSVNGDPAMSSVVAAQRGMPMSPTTVSPAITTQTLPLRPSDAIGGRGRGSRAPARGRGAGGRRRGGRAVATGGHGGMSAGYMVTDSVDLGSPDVAPDGVAADATSVANDVASDAPTPPPVADSALLRSPACEVTAMLTHVIVQCITVSSRRSLVFDNATLAEDDLDASTDAARDAPPPSHVVAAEAAAAAYGAELRSAPLARAATAGARWAAAVLTADATAAGAAGTGDATSADAAGGVRAPGDGAPAWPQGGLPTPWRVGPMWVASVGRRAVGTPAHGGWDCWLGPAARAAAVAVGGTTCVCSRYSGDGPAEECDGACRVAAAADAGLDVALTPLAASAVVAYALTRALAGDALDPLPPEAQPRGNVGDDDAAGSGAACGAADGGLGAQARVEQQQPAGTAWAVATAAGCAAICGLLAAAAPRALLVDARDAAARGEAASNGGGRGSSAAGAVDSDAAATGDAAPPAPAARGVSARACASIAASIIIAAATAGRDGSSLDTLLLALDASGNPAAGDTSQPTHTAAQDAVDTPAAPPAADAPAGGPDAASAGAPDIAPAAAYVSGGPATGTIAGIHLSAPAAARAALAAVRAPGVLYGGTAPDWLAALPGSVDPKGDDPDTAARVSARARRKRAREETSDVSSDASGSSTRRERWVATRFNCGTAALSAGYVPMAAVVVSAAPNVNTMITSLAPSVTAVANAADAAATRVVATASAVDLITHLTTAHTLPPPADLICSCVRVAGGAFAVTCDLCLRRAHPPCVASNVKQARGPRQARQFRCPSCRLRARCALPCVPPVATPPPRIAGHEYCVCRRVYVPPPADAAAAGGAASVTDTMVYCRTCRDWLHPQCIGITVDTAVALGPQFICPNCVDENPELLAQLIEALRPSPLCLPVLGAHMPVAAPAVNSAPLPPQAVAQA